MFCFYLWTHQFLLYVKQMLIIQHFIHITQLNIVNSTGARNSKHFEISFPKTFLFFICQFSYRAEIRGPSDAQNRSQIQSTNSNWWATQTKSVAVITLTINNLSAMLTSFTSSIWIKINKYSNTHTHTYTYTYTHHTHIQEMWMNIRRQHKFVKWRKILRLKQMILNLKHSFSFENSYYLFIIYFSRNPQSTVYQIEGHKT